MDCNETRPLLAAYIDGELDLVRQIAMADHIANCPGCAAIADNIKVARVARQENLPRFTASPALREKIQQALREESAADVASSANAEADALSRPDGHAPSIRVVSTNSTNFADRVATPAARVNERAQREPLRPIHWLGSTWGWSALAASLAVMLALGYEWGGTRARRDLLLDEAVADHIRSLQADHLTDVASTDQHTVKPWFAGKLDFSPPVIDLAADGFPLVGGRVDRYAGHTAAALVFRVRQHPINLLVWPADGDAPPNGATTRAGYHVESWSQSGFHYIAMTDAAPADLARFADLYRAAAR